MMFGRGKYDDACGLAREHTDASSVLLIVFGGKLGDGFAVQADPLVVLMLPRILRKIADEIESNDQRV